MVYMLSPIPMDEILAISPRQCYPRFYNKYGNFREHKMEEYFHTPEGQKLHSLTPFRINECGNKHNTFITLFWDLVFTQLYYNQDMYVYIINNRWYFKHIGWQYKYSTLVDYSKGRDTLIFNQWYNGDIEIISSKLDELEQSIDGNKTDYWGFKIDGVKPDEGEDETDE